MSIPTIKIPKQLSDGEDLIVVRRKDFEAFSRWQEEVADALAKVVRGRQEHRRGRAITASSSRALR